MLISNFSQKSKVAVINLRIFYYEFPWSDTNGYFFPHTLLLWCRKDFFNLILQRLEVCEETDQEENKEKKKKSVSKNGKKKKQAGAELGQAQYKID